MSKTQNNLSDLGFWTSSAQPKNISELEQTPDNCGKGPPKRRQGDRDSPLEDSLSKTSLLTASSPDLPSMMDYPEMGGSLSVLEQSIKKVIESSL
jgi:hypothetical protein